MDLRQLRYFLASADEGNMGRAARRLFVVQSALSRQIRELEREVGASLFDRTPRGVTLTAVGEAFLPHARRTVEQAATALDVARAAARGVAGHLRIAPPDVGPWPVLVAEALERFRSARPAVEVTLSALPWVEHVGALLDGRIDVGFGLAPDPDGYPAGLTARRIDRARLRTALLPAGHPLARKRSVEMDEIAGLPMVLSRREAMPELHDVILGALRSQGVEPTLVEAPGSFAAVGQLVAGGAGWAAVLDVVRHALPPGTVARRVRGLDATLDLHLLRRTEGEGTATALVFEGVLEEVRSG